MIRYLGILELRKNISRSLPLRGRGIPNVSQLEAAARAKTAKLSIPEILFNA